MAASQGAVRRERNDPEATCVKEERQLSGSDAADSSRKVRTRNRPLDSTMQRSMVTLRRKVLAKRWAESLTEWVGKERETEDGEF